MEDKKKLAPIAFCILLKSRKLYIATEKKGLNIPTFALNGAANDDDTKKDIQLRLLSSMKLDSTKPQFLGEFCM